VSADERDLLIFDTDATGGVTSIPLSGVEGW
jgi:hypothetical protein